MTAEEIQQLEKLIEKAKATLTSESGEVPSFVYVVGGELRGETAWISTGNYRTFSLKEEKVEVYEQPVY